ncbi:MAG: hypothetical protein C0483_18960 [Pirellula sp.]|nr:hypothetical protein [Pirellula sp.]
MNVSAAEIERMVRDVLSRMTAAAPAPTTTSTSSPASLLPSREKPAEGRTRGVLELTNRVIALGDIDGRLTEINQLIVDPKAVVTPAVRDILRQRKILLVRQAAGTKTSSAVKRSIAIAVAAARFDAARLVDGLRRDGYGVQQLAQSGLASSVRELAEEAARGGVRALLIADEAEVAVVAANRRSGVRAIAGDEPQSVARAASAVDANLLVVRPMGKSDYLLQRVVAAWLTARSNVPNELLELLK